MSIPGTISRTSVGPRDPERPSGYPGPAGRHPLIHKTLPKGSGRQSDRRCKELMILPLIDNTGHGEAIYACRVTMQARQGRDRL